MKNIKNYGLEILITLYSICIILAIVPGFDFIIKTFKYFVLVGYPLLLLRNTKKVNIHIIIILISLAFPLLGTISGQQSAFSFSFFAPYIVTSFFISLMVHYRNNDNKFLIKLLKLNGIILTVLTTISLVMFVAGIESFTFMGEVLKPNAYGRIAGLYSNATHGGMYATYAIIISCFFWFVGSKKEKYFWFVSAIINVIYCYFSYSRGAYLTLVLVLVACLIAYAFSNRNLGKQVFKKLWLAILAVIVLMISSAVITTAIDNIFYDNIHNMFTQDGEESDLFDRGGDFSAGRFDLWLDGIKIFKERPVFGYSHTDINNKICPSTSNRLCGIDHKKLMQTHNSYIYVLMTLGIVGSAVLFGIVGYYLIIVIRNLYMKNNSANIILFGLLISTLMAALYITTLFIQNDYSEFLLFIILGLLANKEIVNN